MGFTCGFFNSKGHDRKYDADQFSAIFDGIIKDGVFDSIGKMFSVVPNTSMAGRLAVTVNEGKAWFDHTWNLNDSQIPLVIEPADVTLTRYDAVILETNHTDPIRNNAIKIKKGIPASNPSKPTMVKSKDINQHPFAYIRVRPGTATITGSDIENVVGRTECPFVTGVIETADITDLFNQWQGDFDTWFDNVKDQLSGNVVANLQKQIDERVKYADKANADQAKEPSDDTHWMTPKKTASAVEENAYLIGDIRTSAKDLEQETGGKYLACDGRYIRKSTYPKLADAVKENFGIPFKNLGNSPSAIRSEAIALPNIDTRVFFGFDYNKSRDSVDFCSISTNKLIKTASISSSSFSPRFGVPFNNKVYIVCGYNYYAPLYLADPSTGLCTYLMKFSDSSDSGFRGASVLSGKFYMMGTSDVAHDVFTTDAGNNNKVYHIDNPSNASLGVPAELYNHYTDAFLYNDTIYLFAIHYKERERSEWVTKAVSFQRKVYEGNDSWSGITNPEINKFITSIKPFTGSLQLSSDYKALYYNPYENNVNYIPGLINGTLHKIVVKSMVPNLTISNSNDVEFAIRSDNTLDGWCITSDNKLFYAHSVDNELVFRTSPINGASSINVLTDKYITFFGVDNASHCYAIDETQSVIPYDRQVGPGPTVSYIRAK